MAQAIAVRAFQISAIGMLALLADVSMTSARCNTVVCKAGRAASGAVQAPIKAVQAAPKILANPTKAPEILAPIVSVTIKQDVQNGIDAAKDIRTGVGSALKFIGEHSRSTGQGNGGLEDQDPTSNGTVDEGQGTSTPDGEDPPDGVSEEAWNEFMAALDEHPLYGLDTQGIDETQIEAAVERQQALEKGPILESRRRAFHDNCPPEPEACTVLEGPGADAPKAEEIDLPERFREGNPNGMVQTPDFSEAL